MVCHDGSEESQKALNTIHHGLLRDEDTLLVAHAWSNEKEQYLRYNLKRDYIKQQNQADFTYLADRFEYVEDEVNSKEGEKAKEVLNRIATNHYVHLTVVGSHGRKGPKADPTVMGTAVQYLSVESAGPVMIIKDPKTRKDRPDGYTHAICTDGSRKSMEALALLCKIKHPNDKIYVIICEQENIDSTKIKENVLVDLEERECLERSTIQILKSELGKKTQDLIREHLMENKELYVDFIFVGN